MEQMFLGIDSRLIWMKPMADVNRILELKMKVAQIRILKWLSSETVRPKELDRYISTSRFKISPFRSVTFMNLVQILSLLPHLLLSCLIYF